MFANILLPMLFGFAVFMTGMKLMELALHRWAGPYLRATLERATATPLHGFAAGTATTAVLQSSTAVTVITIGLVNSGLLTFPRTLGIVLGTNVGTSLTTELIGLNLSRLTVPLMALSFIGWLASALLWEASPHRTATMDDTAAKPRWLTPLRYGSVAVFGFSLLLLGINVMQSIAPAVEAMPLFGWFIDRAGESVLWGIAAGVALTAAVHSSAAVIAMMMGLAAFGAVPVEIGIAAVLGANVGTCFTALLASVGGTPAGRFVAWAHIALNVGGVVLFAPLVGELAVASSWLSDSPATQIAHAQTIFNMVSSLVALPLCYLPVWSRRPLRL
ncbi:sodium:phosphate symporter [Paenibacillus darwinianus]|uniref:Sodium:phosphate symporter n=1 Tax=Paenibacillus darwinianus TaxID=1380763 RepID=A0A9W5S0Y9_9BACL|nr:Na/Pi symporter [Paenibacillus darwinianus]EXX87981.1 sodium:phosphate symporter [Paenibacillus darwinianus]EXX88031.1 sodium:phosphate symporter [Paenibacillus darwinianus]EXX89209.1 sodium:phosphate symporter [Paenibacillus darwinianus]